MSRPGVLEPVRLPRDHRRLNAIPPILWVDRYVGGGTGIMLDDVLAGIAAWIILFLCYQAGFL